MTGVAVLAATTRAN